MKQAIIELMRNIGCLIAEMPAINGMKGRIAGISLPIKIPLQPYLLKKFSPLINIASLFFRKSNFLSLGPKNRPE